MRIIIETDREPPIYNRSRTTEEHIRENQRKNRLQREKEERARAAQNNNSEPSNEQDTQETGKG